MTTKRIAKEIERRFPTSNAFVRRLQTDWDGGKRIVLTWADGSPRELPRPLDPKIGGSLLCLAEKNCAGQAALFDPADLLSAFVRANT